MNGFNLAFAGPIPDLRVVRVFIAAAASYLLLGISLSELEPGTYWYLMTGLFYVACFAIAIGAFAVQTGVIIYELLKCMQTNRA